MASAVASSITGGSTIRTSAYKSPGVPVFGFTPCPRTRSLAPLLVRRRHSQRNRAAGRGHIDFAAVDRLGQCDGNAYNQIVAAALEIRMRGDVNGEKNVAGRSAADALAALTAQTDFCAVLDAGGNFHFNAVGLSAGRWTPTSTLPPSIAV